MISVKDCGEGISEENLSKIFDPFFQVEQGSKSDLFGSGIGLNMVQYVVRLHKGKISVESTPGHGAEFLVELNLRKKSGRKKSQNWSNLFLTEKKYYQIFKFSS